MKFILLSQKIDNEGTQMLIPVIFSDVLIHRDVAEINQMLLRQIYRKNGLPDASVISAGFYNQLNGNCYGESESLKISCSKNTTEIIKNINYGCIFNKDFSLNF